MILQNIKMLSLNLRSNKCVAVRCLNRLSILPGKIDNCCFCWNLCAVRLEFYLANNVNTLSIYYVSDAGHADKIEGIFFIFCLLVVDKLSFFFLSFISSKVFGYMWRNKRFLCVFFFNSKKALARPYTFRLHRRLKLFSAKQHENMGKCCCERAFTFYSIHVQCTFMFVFVHSSVLNGVRRFSGWWWLCRFHWARFFFFNFPTFISLYLHEYAIMTPWSEYRWRNE